MYCPHTVLIDSRVLFVILHTTGDYNWYHQIPLGNWLNPLRYELIFFTRTRFRVKINKDGKAHIAFSNAIFNLRRWFREA